MRREFVLASVVLSGALATAAAAIAAQQAPAGAPAAQGQGRGDGQGRGGDAAGRGDGQGRGAGRGGAPIGMIEKVADNLYMIPGAGGNSGVYVTANGVVLVDTKNPNNGQGILDQIKTVTDKPVMMIINTHTHGDHTGSNMFFPPTVEIVTHENTAMNMAKEGANPNFNTPENKHGLPDRSFKDKMSLLKGKDRIDLYYYGRAHTNGDTLVVFREARVMHAGDMFANKGPGLIDPNNGGSGLEWGATIGKAAKGIKNVDKVITGHSTVMTWKDFVDYGEVNALVAAYAREASKAGKTPEQAMMEFKLPEKFTTAGYTFAAGGRGGPGGNFGIIFGELKPAK